MQLPEHGAEDDPLAVIGSAAAVVLATPGEQPYTGAHPSALLYRGL